MVSIGVGLRPTPRPFFFRKDHKARNGGRRSRSAAKPQSDRWSPKRFAPTLASLRFPFLWVLSLLSLYGGPIRRPAGAFRSPWPWKVWRFAPARSVLRSPGRASPFRSHRRRRRRPGLQPPGLLQASKLLNFQASRQQKKEPRGVGSRAVTTTRKECELTQKMAGRTGLEPATSGSTVRSSNQLSYLPGSRKHA